MLVSCYNCAYDVNESNVVYKIISVTIDDKCFTGRVKLVCPKCNKTVLPVSYKANLKTTSGVSRWRRKTKR